MPLRSPTIYSLATDEEQRPEFFVIAMEDLTVHSKVFDQVDDPPNEHFMRRMALDVITSYRIHYTKLYEMRYSSS